MRVALRIILTIWVAGAETVYVGGADQMFGRGYPKYWTEWEQPVLLPREVQLYSHSSLTENDDGT